MKLILTREEVEEGTLTRTKRHNIVIIIKVIKFKQNSINIWKHLVALVLCQTRMEWLIHGARCERSSFVINFRAHFLYELGHLQWTVTLQRNFWFRAKLFFFKIKINQPLSKSNSSSIKFNDCRGEYATDLWLFGGGQRNPPPVFCCLFISYLDWVFLLQYQSHYDFISKYQMTKLLNIGTKTICQTFPFTLL